jgi:hypothetical protein
MKREFKDNSGHKSKRKVAIRKTKIKMGTTG